MILFFTTFSRELRRHGDILGWPDLFFKSPISIFFHTIGTKFYVYYFTHRIERVILHGSKLDTIGISQQNMKDLQQAVGMMDHPYMPSIYDMPAKRKFRAPNCLFVPPLIFF